MTGRPAWPVLAIMTLSLTGTACFDVERVDPGPPVLDDFEDGDLTPSLRAFGAWYCSLYNPAAPLDCALTEGFQSSAGLSVGFSIVDSPDGEQQRGVVQFETDADTPIDLTGSSAITFDVRLTNAPVASPGGAGMRLQLRCSTAVGENGAALRDFVVIQTVPYAAEWSSVSLAMSNFGPAEWLPGALRDGTPACLRAVDGFQLVFDPAVPDGQTLAGVLSIDNVRLR